MLRLTGGIAGAAAALASYPSLKKARAESLPWQREGGEAPSPPDYSWLLGQGGAVGEPLEEGQAKVLLLAYPRTGSSLLGELLAASPATSYFMEPLFALLQVGQLDWDYALEARVEAGEVPGQAVVALMAGLFSCGEGVVGRLGEWSRQPHTSVTAVPVEECRGSGALLAKTVRLHGPLVTQVAASVPELRVVHLVRDPRAVVASLQAQAEEWGGRSGETYCKQLLADMAVGEELGPGRYLRVSYEELLEKPEEVLSRIAIFTGVAVTKEVKEAVAVRMGGKAKVRASDSVDLAASETTEYYSTVRGAGHRHDGWRRRLREEEVEALECGVCGEVMDRLGYSRLAD